MKVFITGVSAGLGKVLAKKLINKGYEVWGVARRENLLSELAKELNTHKFHYTCCDVSDRSQVLALRNLMMKQNFFPDAYILNAAITSEPVELFYEEIVNINLTGPFHIVEQLLAEFPAEPNRQVIAISSLFAVLPDNRNYAYAASKSGLSAAIQSLRYDPRFTSVSFKNVLLGPIDSQQQLKKKSLFVSGLDYAADKTIAALYSSNYNYYYTVLNYLAVKLFPFFPIKLIKFLYLKLRR